jgi:hypothetical protein
MGGEAENRAGISREIVYGEFKGSQKWVVIRPQSKPRETESNTSKPICEVE